MKHNTSTSTPSVFNPLNRDHAGAYRQFLIKAAGFTQREIAHRCKVAYPSVHDVVHGRRKSHRIASAISDLVGVPLSALYPDGCYDQQPSDRPSPATSTTRGV